MKPAVKNALIIGGTCTVGYMFVYFVRNILSVVSPKMIEDGLYTEAQIGNLSSVFFITYAIGQLINGILGDKIKSKYMISFGLILAGITNIAFCFKSAPFSIIYISYALCGFFLSMIYGPLTKLVAENTEPLYASRCSVAYNFSSFIGAPIAGFFAIVCSWAIVFLLGGISVIIMGILSFIIFSVLEKKGVITYTLKRRKSKSDSGIKELFKRKILKFTFVSILTGVIRTTVVFWLPTYYTQYLSYSSEESAVIFSITSLIMSLNAFLAIIVYEKLNRNIDLTLLLSFGLSAVFFISCVFIKLPLLNIVLINLAIFSANCASTMLWSRYCPGLRSTGLVSSATGYLDFVSYMAASVSSTVFANAVSVIGWEKLIIVWCLLMVVGVFVSIPYDKNSHYLDE
ncbi:MAG: MFS transporter [Clostridia bacterium]|nr:MFS transporter [Clostridia bacterium]